MSDSYRISRPCAECPWRLDATPGRFDPERWESLKQSCHDDDTGSAPLGAPLFACHQTPEGKERACAGWLAVEGAGHVSVRLAVATGRVPASALKPGPDWPSLFGSFTEAATHDLAGRA